MNDKPTAKVWEAAGFLMITMVVSRILGYLRDVFIYASFGQNNLTDAYNAAFSIPDFLYMVLVGGALSSALIPVLGNYIANDQREEGWRVTSIVYSCVMVLLFFGVIIGMIFTPQLVNLMVPGFDAPTKLLTVRLTRIMFVQVIFMCLAGISMGVLNSYKRFAPSAIGSMLYNVAVSYTHLETAEMPGFYGEDEYDIAGFAVGVADKSKIITGAKVVAGDVLVGLPSTGLHSNGYSLARKVLLDGNYGYDYDTYVEALGMTVGQAMLVPTKIYVKEVLPLLDRFEIHGMCHVTGGGLLENLPRVFDPALAARLHTDAWQVPGICQPVSYTHL